MIDSIFMHIFVEREMTRVSIDVSCSSFMDSGIPEGSRRLQLV